MIIKGLKTDWIRTRAAPEVMGIQEIHHNLSPSANVGAVILLT